MKTTVLNSQSILDISIQHTGTVENCFAIAVANGLSVSDLVTAGSRLEIQDNISINSDVLNYYTAKKIHPATGDTGDRLIAEPGGIGYMEIGYSFVVS